MPFVKTNFIGKSFKIPFAKKNNSIGKVLKCLLLKKSFKISLAKKNIIRKNGLYF
jgi:hypothetical protein